jgi:hypothetical protein
MMYKAKRALCSVIHTKHSTQNDRHVEFFNVKPCWYVKKPLGFKRLNIIIRIVNEVHYISNRILL